MYKVKEKNVKELGKIIATYNRLTVLDLCINKQTKLGYNELNSESMNIILKEVRKNTSIESLYLSIHYKSYRQ